MQATAMQIGKLQLLMKTVTTVSPPKSNVPSQYPFIEPCSFEDSAEQRKLLP